MQDYFFRHLGNSKIIRIRREKNHAIVTLVS